MDYKWAQELGLIPKPATLISILYNGTKISEVVEDIGRWCRQLALVQRRTYFLFLYFSDLVCSLVLARFLGLPPWATKFIEMVLVLTADRGPAVSGAMNTIVATRAGKDLISSLASGLLTIGSRFSGASMRPPLCSRMLVTPA